jgi:hypothetical protein
MSDTSDRFHSDFKRRFRAFITPEVEAALDRALAELDLAGRRYDSDPTVSGRADLEDKRLAYNSILCSIQRAEAEANDRAVVERQEAFYRDREEAVEKKRLAHLRELKEWDKRWLAYRYDGAPKPEPLPPE